MTVRRPRYFETPILTCQECADYLSVSRSTIYRLIKHGKIPAFRMGADWRFSKKALTEWVESQARGEVSRAPPAPPRPRSKR